MTKPTPKIDRSKLRSWLRGSSDDLVFSMLDDAIELLPTTKLAKLVGAYVEVDQFLPDRRSTSKDQDLFADVADFDARSRAGQYYEGFAVNSRNSTTSSKGTRAFFADCRRLFERCVQESATLRPLRLRASIEVLFALLRHINECRDDVIFVADDGGTWEIGIQWVLVLPLWISCLSKTAFSKEFAQLVVENVDAFDSTRRDRYFAAARAVATPAQRRALAAAVKPTSGQR